MAFVQGKSKIITVNQVSWVISRKELEAARMCAMLMVAVRDSLQHLGCTIHFWSDSQVVLKWIINHGLLTPTFTYLDLQKGAWIRFVSWRLLRHETMLTLA